METKQLIDDLRKCSDPGGWCIGCSRTSQIDCTRHLQAEAADLIEELVRKVEQLERTKFASR